MLNWLSQNKQWLFSGVGVSIFLLIGGFVLHAFRRPSALPAAPAPPAFPPMPRPPAATLLPPVTGSYSKPTPREIKGQIEALPPFQQKAAEEAYKGLKVRWPARFSSISEGLAKKWTVFLTYDGDSSEFGSRVIFCDNVDIDAFPKLKFAHAGTRVDVSGSIKSIEGLGIVLGDVTIEFKD
jgi:hypothetical protein